MSCKPMISLQAVDKCYRLYAKPIDRLKQFFWRGKRKFYQDFWALRQINLQVNAGEVVGIVGCNGAGKSTLLQLICGTLTQSAGDIQVQGRVAALLELGAGFNPEFSGRENVWMNAAILGLSDTEIGERFTDIVEFSGVADFIDQPVKTYSSGMYVRLAFAVATSVAPDILIIDEALSVGDGAFARKSFDRIMQLKEAGKTILFCSHSLYHIEAICDRAIWLNQGVIEKSGDPAEVVSAYDSFLAGHDSQPETEQDIQKTTLTGPPNSSRITKVECWTDTQSDGSLALQSSQSTLSIKISFVADLSLDVPSIYVTIVTKNETHIASAGSKNDGVALTRAADGSGAAVLVFPKIPLLKGEYYINVYLACEQALHVYDHFQHAEKLYVTQSGLERGFVSLPHRWET
jgi:lipopolysaccharide transport system ATP-binding protein